MTKVQKQRIRAWVKALRSGEFRQTKGRLRRGNTFCCLGVACELYRRKTGDGEWRRATFAVQNETNIQVMPPIVGKWFGVDPDPSLREFETAAMLNDEGRSFAEIADAIEAHLLTETEVSHANPKR